MEKGECTDGLKGRPFQNRRLIRGSLATNHEQLTAFVAWRVILDGAGHVIAGFALLGAEGGGVAVEQPQQIALQDRTRRRALTQCLQCHT